MNKWPDEKSVDRVTSGTHDTGLGEEARPESKQVTPAATVDRPPTAHRGCGRAARRRRK